MYYERKEVQYSTKNQTKEARFIKQKLLIGSARFIGSVE